MSRFVGVLEAYPMAGPHPRAANCDSRAMRVTKSHERSAPPLG